MGRATLEDYSEADVLHWLGEAEVARGRDFVDRVRELEAGAERIRAEIPGKAKKPYVAVARLITLRDGEPMLVSACSCPAGTGCEHTAAMLLRALAEREAEAEEPAPAPAGGSLLSWVEDLRRASIAVAKKKTRPASARQQLFYILKWTPDQRQFGIELRKGKYPENADAWWAVDRALVATPQFVGDEDLAILRLLWADRGQGGSLKAFALNPRHGAELLQRMAATHRLFAPSDLSLPLQAAAQPRPATVGWEVDARGHQRPRLLPEPPAEVVIGVDPPWYFDVAHGEIGPLEVAGNPGLVRRLFDLPPLTEQDVERVAEALAEASDDLSLPAEAASQRLRVVDRPLQPVLQLDTLQTHGYRRWRHYPQSYAGGPFDVARAIFRYGDADLAPEHRAEFVTLPEGETVSVRRHPEAERKALAALAEAGLLRIPGYTLHTFGASLEGLYGLASETDWPRFMRDRVPELKAAGWQVECPEDFRHYLLDVEAWEADLVAGDSGWFNLDMGIMVEGRRLPLAPLLADLFRRDERWLDALRLTYVPDDEPVQLLTDTGTRIRVSAGRLKPLALMLIDLFDGFTGGDTLRVSRFDAQRLAEFNDTRRWQFRGQGDILALADKLRAAQGVSDVAPPRGLQLELRPYQREGLSWLQFLRAQNLSGILADDMGLGKTAQTLAHLLLEKEEGRLTRPALIVLPTSLIFNWKNEAARFAPDLRVLSLHGPERKSRFAEIPAHDVVLTTYPLLWRDVEALTAHEYHLLILDEAQTVKNAQSQSAEAVRKLRAAHRLCLTGTPLENHLGELWSQFDFLLPGFLGDLRSFTRYWRTPIEKQGDSERRDLLARRIRPFVLRRKKEDVATELPPKTVIVRSVELEGSQRDLYETVRAAMDAKVREEIASKGFSRSQIVILDALLKLRQVCCDPRLVKARAAQRVTERAKLDLLMGMLPELVDEGRRILVFSQFTSMLSLIEPELEKAGLGYVKLTGATTDREAPIRRFQEGEAPIFLISLKAGGVGLNLTAADTVIHFDPWWNPAVENQATDRAHRLGQDKPVFVYKLIVAGSIEEKILALQERKAELAAGILSEDRGQEVKFGDDDLAALFAPLPA